MVFFMNRLMLARVDEGDMQFPGSAHFCIYGHTAWIGHQARVIDLLSSLQMQGRLSMRPLRMFFRNANLIMRWDVLFYVLTPMREFVSCFLYSAIGPLGGARRTRRMASEGTRSEKM